MHLTYKGVVRDKTLWIQSSGRAQFTNDARTKRDLDSKVPAHIAELYREDACILKTLLHSLRLCFFQFSLLKGYNYCQFVKHLLSNNSLFQMRLVAQGVNLLYILL